VAADIEIQKVMEENEGYGSSISSVPDDEENIDDMGAEEWEEHCGGPEDSEIEDMEEEPDEADEDELSDESDDVAEADVEEGYWNALLEEGNKVVDIVSWLEKSKLVNLIDNGKEGFYVRRGAQVVINSEVVEGFDWLLSLGFGIKIKNVRNYLILYVESNFPASERLWFLKSSHVVSGDLRLLTPDSNKHEASMDWLDSDECQL